MPTRQGLAVYRGVYRARRHDIEQCGLHDRLRLIHSHSAGAASAAVMTDQGKSLEAGLAPAYVPPGGVAGRV